MNTSAAIADPLLRRASGQRARLSDLHRTVGNWRPPSWRLSPGLRTPVSLPLPYPPLPSLTLSHIMGEGGVGGRTVMNHAGCRMLKQSVSTEKAEGQAKVEAQMKNGRSSLSLDLDISLLRSLWLRWRPV